MKLRKKALFPAIAMVLAAVIALSGVTYAWFTTGTTASVQELHVNVATANGVQVSLDGSTWKSIITVDDIIAAVNSTIYKDNKTVFPYDEGKKMAKEIAPVSSAGIWNDEKGQLDMFLGEYKEDGGLMSTALTDKKGYEGNYIAFDLFFKYSSGNQPLSMDWTTGESTVVASTAFGGNATAGAENAVRIAFIPMGSASSEDLARTTLTAPLTDESGNDIIHIWEPNWKIRSTGVTATSGVKDTYGFMTSFATGDGDTGIDEASLNQEGSAYSAKVATFDEEDRVITNLANTYTKVRVYIWLEGQDVDCINNISNGDFVVNMQFSVPEDPNA